jgi:hypothetical protein
VKPRVLLVVHSKKSRRLLAMLPVPAVGTENTTDVEEGRLDRHWSANEDGTRRCTIESGKPQRKTNKLVRARCGLA